MTSVPLPFITKSPNPLLTFVCLGLTFGAFLYAAYLLSRHHAAERKARKQGRDRRHEGLHGNH